jgi:hypothetical protein
MTTKVDKARQAEAIDELRAMLPPGSEVKTILRHCSRSGMSRSISVVIDGEDLTWLAARAMGEKFDRYGGITRGGCGTDMGFDLVYSLSRRLYPDGFECIGWSYDLPRADRCPSSDHSNHPRETFMYHSGNGGYALKQRWL